MKQIIVGITLLAVLTQFSPAHANVSTQSSGQRHLPVTGLIGDWAQFQAGILAKTSQYDRYNSIRPDQVAQLPQTLIGKWTLHDAHDGSGYRIHAVLALKPDHRFVYHYRIRSGAEQDAWHYSGQWQVKNRILVLLIKRSDYPGEAVDDVLFWRLLRVGQHSLVYVRSGVNRMQAMTRHSAVGVVQHSARVAGALAFG